MDATGTISGDSINVRIWLLRGIFWLSIHASSSDPITADGTAISEKIAVFFAANRKDWFWNRFRKLSKPTNSWSTGLFTKA